MVGKEAAGPHLGGPLDLGGRRSTCPAGPNGSTAANTTRCASGLQIGRAYAMAGEATKVNAAYKDFLTLFKDADADIPIRSA